MLDILFSVFYVCLAVLMICGTSFVVQWSIERFLFVFLKNIALYIDQIKHPEEYKNVSEQ